MDYKVFDSLCKKLIACYQKLNKEATLDISARADESEIIKVEEEIGMTLPGQLRDFFLNYTSGFDIHAYIPDEFIDSLPHEFRELMGAMYEISLQEVLENEMSRRHWVEECFPDEDDEYDKVWHNKLGIIAVGNGDIIALDTEKDPENPPVVYLSHDDGTGHGVILGKDFNTFLMNLINVGGCGMEYEQIFVFMPDRKAGIDTDCENAVFFREQIGFV